jgi:repressor LexA
MMGSDIESAHRQLKLLELILKYAERGEPLPSLQVVADKLGLTARSNVSRALGRLEEKGFIKCERTPRGYIKTSTVRLAKVESSRPVPLLGKIGAGDAILVDGDDLREFLPLPAKYVRGPKVYMLEVSGESMTGDGILDGDYVVVRAGAEFRDGDVCVVLNDNSEAMVKHVYRDDGALRLESSNPAFGPKRLEEVENPLIRGKVIGLVRWLS